MPDFVTLRRERPFIPLFTEENSCSRVSTVNNGPASFLDDLAKWYVHFHAEASNQFFLGTSCKGASPTTFAKKMALRGAMTSNYRNGSYVSQASGTQINMVEAELFESNHPLGINTFWPPNSRDVSVQENQTATAGRLSVALTATATTVKVRSNVAYKPTVKITGATNASPILVTTAVNHGFKTGDRVRIANVAGNLAANGDWTITVVSSASFSLNTSAGTGAYDSGGTVSALSTAWPYIVSKGPNGTLSTGRSKNCADYVSWVRIDDEIMQITGITHDASVVTLTVRRGFFGTVAVTHALDARVFSPIYIGANNAGPGDGGLNGTPVIDNANQGLRYGVRLWDPEGTAFLADQMERTFNTDGDFQGYNTVWLDICGCGQYNNAAWDGTPRFGWDAPIAAKLVKDKWGQYQRSKIVDFKARFESKFFSGNGLDSSQRDARDNCSDALLGAVAGTPPAYDGAPLEHWMKHDPAFGQFKITSYDVGVGQMLAAFAQNAPIWFWVRWAYLISSGFDAAKYRRFAYGTVLLGWRPTATKMQYGGPFGLEKPDQFFFWELGAPVTTPVVYADIEVVGGLHRREYANGWVYVNATANPVTRALGGTFYDAYNLDASGNPKPVTSVTVASFDSALLIKEESTTPPPEPPPPSPAGAWTVGRIPV